MQKQWKLGGLAGLVMLLIGCVSNPPAEDAAAASVSNPDHEVTLVAPIRFAESANVQREVRSECRLTEKLERFVVEASAQENIAVVGSDRPADELQGKVLTIEIVDVPGQAGGAFSGGKAVTIEGELTENGEVLGTFAARRVSGGGAFAAFRGTCNILGHDVRTLGSDVALFLVSPYEDGRLGDL